MKRAVKRLIAGVLIAVACAVTVVPVAASGGGDNTACLCLLLDPSGVLWWVYACYAYSPSDCSSPYGS